MSLPYSSRKSKVSRRNQSSYQIVTLTSLQCSNSRQHYISTSIIFCSCRFLSYGQTTGNWQVVQMGSVYQHPLRCLYAWVCTQGGINKLGNITHNLNVVCMHQKMKGKKRQSRVAYLGVDFLFPLSIFPASTTLSSEGALGRPNSGVAFAGPSVVKLSSADFLLKR